jgi:hypothetical protein
VVLEVTVGHCADKGCCLQTAAPLNAQCTGLAAGPSPEKTTSLESPGAMAGLLAGAPTTRASPREAFTAFQTWYLRSPGSTKVRFQPVSGVDPRLVIVSRPKTPNWFARLSR